MPERGRSQTPDFLPETYIATPSPRATEHQPQWLQLTRHRIGVLLRLKAGWSGPGSTAIDRLLAFRAARTLEAAMKGCRAPVAPFVVPAADGSLQLEWRTEATRFEFYFEVDGSMSAWAQNRESGYEVEAEGLGATELLRKWSSRLSQTPSEPRLPSVPETISA